MVRVKKFKRLPVTYKTLVLIKMWSVTEFLMYAFISS